MASEVMSKERLDYTIDLIVTMVIDELADMIKRDRNELLPEFVLSETGKALYDDSTKLWWCGPSYIAEMYIEEVKHAANAK